MEVKLNKVIKSCNNCQYNYNGYCRIFNTTDLSLCDVWESKYVVFTRDVIQDRKCTNRWRELRELEVKSQQLSDKLDNLKLKIKAH